MRGRLRWSGGQRARRFGVAQTAEPGEGLESPLRGLHLSVPDDRRGGARPQCGRGADRRRSSRAAKGQEEQLWRTHEQVRRNTSLARGLQSSASRWRRSAPAANRGATGIAHAARRWRRGDIVFSEALAARFNQIEGYGLTRAVGVAKCPLALRSHNPLRPPTLNKSLQKSLKQPTSRRGRGHGMPARPRRHRVETGRQLL